MSITRESAYLYLCSKELTKLNKKLHDAGQEAQKLAQKYHQAADEKTRYKYGKKHHQALEERGNLMKEYREMLSGTKHHLVNFNNALRKELKQ